MNNVAVQANLTKIMAPTYIVIRLKQTWFTFNIKVIFLEIYSHFVTTNNDETALLFHAISNEDQKRHGPIYDFFQLI